MKRYQCIKDWYYLSDDSDENLLFKQGVCYPETNEEPYLPGNVVIRCEDGHGVQVTPDVVKTYFQELLDLNIDDHEDEQYTAMIPSPKRIGIGCAILIVTILTVLALIFFG